MKTLKSFVSYLFLAVLASCGSAVPAYASSDSAEPIAVLILFTLLMFLPMSIFMWSVVRNDAREYKNKMDTYQDSLNRATHFIGFIDTNEEENE